MAALDATILLFALRDAVTGGTPFRMDKQELKRLEVWLAVDDDDYHFSLLNLCQRLGVDRHAFRAKVAAERAAANKSN